MHLFGSPTDQDVESIADRLRSVLGEHRADLVAAQFELPVEQLHELMVAEKRTTDVRFLLDVVAALVQQWGIDPEWLLTGEYDSALHRQALSLGEDRTKLGVAAVRELVENEYRRRLSARVLSLPSFGDIIQHRATG